MRKTKKILAAVLAATLALAPTAVYAEEVTDAAAASGSATSTGELEGYVDEEAFCVVLPAVSSDALKFALDPQGLLTIKDNTYATDTAVTAGAIVFPESTNTTKTYSSIFTAVNRSSYDVTMSLDLSVENASPSGLTFVDSAEDAVSGDGLNLYLALVPEKSYVGLNTTGDAATVATGSAIVDSYTADPATSYAFAIDNSSLKATAAYNLQGNEDNYSIVATATSAAIGASTYEYQLDEDASDWKAVGFSITGKCNKNADWSDYLSNSDELTCKLAWTLTKTTGTPEAFDGTCPDGLIKEVAAGVAPTIPSTQTYTLSSASDLVFTCDLGSGAAGATAITDVGAKSGGVVYTKNGAWSSDTSFANVFTVSGNTVTVKYTGWMQYYTPGTYEFYIVLDNKTGTGEYYTVNVTVQ